MIALPRDLYDRCPVCQLPQPCGVCDWEGYCQSHQQPFWKCWTINNVRCQPYKKDAPPLVEPPVLDPETETETETEAELDVVEPVPHVPARVPVDFTQDEIREMVRNLSPRFAWKLDHSPIPWRTASHRGEISFTPEGRYETTGFPIDDRSKRSPVSGCHHADSLEKLREIIARECGEPPEETLPVARPPRGVKLGSQGAHTQHHKAQHIYNSQCVSCQRETDKWKRACLRRMRELLAGELKYFQRNRYSRDVAILQGELEPVEAAAVFVK